jgi:hypothetical protein
VPYQRLGQTHAVCKLGGEEALIEDFNGRWRDTPNGTVWHFDASCKYHQETKRHQEKAENLALYVLRLRADTLARMTGTTRHWILYDKRGPCWFRLLPLLEAFLKQHAGCVNCGRSFDGARDTQLDHIHAPRSADDWARHHARNIRILCGTSNNGKRQKDDAFWVDEQYRWQLKDADRTDEQESVAQAQAEAERPRQLSLLDALF